MRTNQTTYDTVPVSALEGQTKHENVRQQYYKSRWDYISKFEAALKQMYNEPLLLDDLMRSNFVELVRYMVLNCETLLCLDGEKVAGICVFNPLKAPRCYEIIGWVAPEYRASPVRQGKVLRTFKQDVIAYAWERLGLNRVEVRIANDNKSAQRFAKNVGFRQIGTARMDLQIAGKLSDSVIFELINPSFEIKPPEKFKGNGRASQSANRQLEPDDGDAPGPGDEPERVEHVEQRSNHKPAVKPSAEYSEQLLFSDGSHELQRTGSSNGEPSGDQGLFSGLAFTPEFAAS